jgi:D-sedoheptulose 7-phosphate isomerase
MSFYGEYFQSISDKLCSVDYTGLDRLSAILEETRDRRGKVLLIGNGGSASVASHVAVDLTKVAGIRALTFSDNSLLTCLANDYGYEHWVEKALEFYAEPGDVAVLISSSGKSPNIVNGAVAAKLRGLQVITLTGFSADNPLRSLGDVNLWVDSRSYNIVEMTHHIWLVAVVDKMFSDKGSRA